MFEHSIKVPRLYKFAAKVAKQVKEDGGSLKDLIYKLNHRNIKAVYALVTTLLKKSNTLDYIIRGSQILIKENRLDPWLARVLITELLWGKKRLPNDNKPCQTIINYSKELTDCLATFNDDAPAKEPNKVKKPRYVRVNTLKLTIAEAINIFRDDGWILLRCGDNSDYGSFLATIASLSHDQFTVDMHVKDLLVFPPNTQFYNNHLYQNGDIVLQDKVCKIINVTPKPQKFRFGYVFGARNESQSFRITNREFPDVEYILVDPSCSGSGMLDRLDYEDPESKCNKSRLQSLAGFQITILRHALNNFPKAKRVVYSTCSVYPDENESVVEQVITTVKDFKLIDLKKDMKSKWFNFGSNDFGEIGERCLYAKPEQDYTNGFFVALFERLSDDETNEFFVRRVKRSSECDNDKENNLALTENISEKGKQKIKKQASVETIDDITINENVSEGPTKKKKKKSKHNKKENNTINNNTFEKSDNNNKRKSELNEEENKNDVNIIDEIKPKKKKKSKTDETIISDLNTSQEISDETKQKKKKSKTNENTDSINKDESLNKSIAEETKPKKKKKSKSNETISNDTTQDISNETKEKKKKKSKKDPVNEECQNENNDETITENKNRKRKHDSTVSDEINESEIKKKKKSKYDK